MESTAKKGFFLTRWGSWLIERCKWSNCGVVGKTIWVLLPPLLLFALFTLRGLYHDLVLFIVLKTPLAILVVLSIRFVVKRVKKREGAWWKKTWTGIKWTFAAVVVYTAGAMSYEYLSLYTNYKTRIQAVALVNMPLTANEKVQAVYSIHSIADKESVDDTKDVSLPHMVRFNEAARKRYGLGQDADYWFTMAVEPSKTKIWQYLFGHVEQVFLTPGNTLSPKFDQKNKEVAKVEFSFGENLILSSNVKTAAIKKLGFWQYFRYEPVNYSIYIPDDNGEFVQVVPLIKWTGILFPMPEYGGAVVFKQGKTPYFEKVLFGGGEVVTADRVKDHGYLHGQLLVPDQVALYAAQTFRFYAGFWAPFWGNHDGDVRVPNPPNSYTVFPFEEYFVLSEVSGGKAEDGLCHYIPLEPYGEGKSMLSLSLFVKGDDSHVYYFDHKTSPEKLMGPTAIPGKVVSELPNYDWNRAEPTEMTPVVRDVYGERHLYWKTNIQTKSGDSLQTITFGKAEIALIDAADRQVCIHLEGDEAHPSNWLQQMELKSSKMPVSKREEEVLLIKD